MQSTPRVLGVSKYLLVIAFVLAVYVVLAQFSALPCLAGSAFRFSYFIFPFFIFSIFLVIYAYSLTLIRAAWKKRAGGMVKW